MLGELLAAVDADRRTVLMTSHNLERSLHLGDRVMILSKGKIAFDKERASMTVETLRERYYELAQ
jgi:ABC-type uncharacterized transport system ATPase component